MKVERRIGSRFSGGQSQNREDGSLTDFYLLGYQRARFHDDPGGKLISRRRKSCGARGLGRFLFDDVAFGGTWKTRNLEFQTFALSVRQRLENTPLSMIDIVLISLLLDRFNFGLFFFLLQVLAQLARFYQ